MPVNAADRIRSLIDGALSSSRAAGRDLDLQEIYVKALTRCGIGRAEALSLLSDPTHDPVARILHFAGHSHNYAVLAVEEALAAA
jgi:hypothetical protein